MTSEFARAIVLATLIAGGAYVIRGMYGTDRWYLAPGPAGTVYRIDRLSGQVHHCDTVVCRVLPTATPVMAPPRTPGTPGAEGTPPQQQQSRPQGSART